MSAPFPRGAVAPTPTSESGMLVTGELSAEPPTPSAIAAPPGAVGVNIAALAEAETGRYMDAGEENFESLGELLVYLRQTYGERFQRTGSSLPHITLAAQSVAAFLNEHDYSMTSGSYSLLEQGKTLPKNPERFLDVISTCLAVSPSSKYWPLLRFQYMYDHARRYVSKEFAEAHFPHGEKLLALLRSGAL